MATARSSPRRREAVEAERVEVVAGEQGEVGVVAGEQARLAVVEQVALADRLDDERVLAGRRGRAGRRGEQAEAGRSAGSTTWAEIGVVLAARSCAARACEARAAGSRRSSASSSDSAAASSVRSIAASSWARETNQASNCEGGG